GGWTNGRVTRVILGTVAGQKKVQVEVRKVQYEIGDDWAWVASGPERQPDAAAGAPRAAEDAPAVDKGAQADPAPVQAPQSPPPPSAVGRTMPQRLGRLKEEMQGLMERSMTDHGRFFT
nr:hypothetical protein [Tanacetum cinerariifolium]